MTNKNKSTRAPEDKPEYKPPTYRCYLESEKEKYMKELFKLYPKHPKPLLEMIFKVHEMETFGTDEQKENIKELMDSIPDNPDLSYFGTNGFQEEIEENKGYKIVENID